MNEITYLKWKDLYKEIKDWAFYPFSENRRMYYKPNEKEENGFLFKEVELIAYPKGEEWEFEDADCEILLNGVAYFDGVRHLYFGDEKCDNFGYFYYPNLQELQESLSILQKLEARYCPNKD